MFYLLQLVVHNMPSISLCRFDRQEKSIFIFNPPTQAEKIDRHFFLFHRWIMDFCGLLACWLERFDSIIGSVPRVRKRLLYSCSFIEAVRPSVGGKAFGFWVPFVTPWMWMSSSNIRHILRMHLMLQTEGKSARKRSKVVYYNNKTLARLSRVKRLRPRDPL